MTRTTELLKEIERLYDKMEVNGSVDTFPFGLKCYNKGRLDVLKEEETYLIQFEKDFQGITPILIGEEIEYRLASIQEEIKLIKSAGVGK